MENDLARHRRLNLDFATLGQPSGINPPEDPDALYPLSSAPMQTDGYGGAGPWYSTPPGGMDPRFLEGIPDARMRITPFDHVVRATRARSPATRYNPGRPRGNTGFSTHPGEPEIGSVSEGAKTAMTGAVLLGALALVMVIYRK